MKASCFIKETSENGIKTSSDDDFLACFYLFFFARTKSKARKKKSSVRLSMFYASYSLFTKAFVALS